MSDCGGWDSILGYGYRSLLVRPRFFGSEEIEPRESEYESVSELNCKKLTKLKISPNEQDPNPVVGV